MRTLARHADDVVPTHNPHTDIGPASEQEFDYDLTVSKHDAPGVKTSYGDVRIGQAEREDDELLDEGRGSIVTARSGNSHWDGDDHELMAEDLGAENRAGPDPGMPIATVVVIGAAVLGLYLLLSKQR